MRHFSVAELSACMLLTACGGGVVTEKDTNKPLEGVVLISASRGSAYGVVGSSSSCYHIAFSRSDAQGRFSRPTRFGMLLKFNAPIEMAYKPGYHMVETGDDSRIVMERHTQTRDIRIEQVYTVFEKQFPADCPKEELEALFDSVLRPLNGEMAPLASTLVEFQKADAPLGMIDAMTLEHQEALIKAMQRKGAWLAQHPSANSTPSTFGPNRLPAGQLTTQSVQVGK